MTKRDYEYLEQCFDELLDAYNYNYAQTEINGFKETIGILKAICCSHYIYMEIINTFIKIHNITK